LLPANASNARREAADSAAAGLVLVVFSPHFHPPPHCPKKFQRSPTISHHLFLFSLYFPDFEGGAGPSI